MIDTELNTWRHQWQTGHGSEREDWATSLKKRVVCQSRRQRLRLIFPVLVTLVIGGRLIERALQTGQSLDIVLAVEGWLFILVVWVGSLWIARGTWYPFAETTAAFVDLSIRRCRANLRALSFAIWLYVGQFVVVVLVKSLYSPGPGAVLTATSTIVLGAIGFPAVVLGGMWFARRQRAELERLLDLKRQLEEG